MSEPTAELLRAALAETRYDNAGNRLMRQGLYAAIVHDPELVAIFHEETRRPEVTDIVEQAAKVACPNGPDHDHQPNLDQGCNWALQLCQTLADAGLLAEPARTTPTREEVETAIGGVLFNASNHPDPVAVLGKDIGPLRDKVTDAVLEVQRENDEMAEIIKSQNVHIEELTKATFVQHTRLAAVEQLHAPGNIVDVWGKSRTMADDFQVCRECTDPDNNWVAWPCDTIKAVSEANP